MSGFLRFTLVLVAFLSIFPLYTRYKAAAAPIPPGVHLAGLELSHLKEPAQIEAAVTAALGQPIAVYYDDTRLVLRPHEIAFQVDTAAMLAEARRYLSGPAFIDIAVRNLAGIPQRRRDIPAIFTYDARKLAAWLWQVGEEMDHPPLPGRALPPQWEWHNGRAPLAQGLASPFPRPAAGKSGQGQANPTDVAAGIPLPPAGDLGRGASEFASAPTLPAAFVGAALHSWRWIPGVPGQTLLIDESARPVLDALGRPHARSAHLALQNAPPPPMNMAVLGAELDAYTSDFPGFAAVYVQDLTTAEEAEIDVHVAFSGMSTMKIAIATEAFRQMDDFEDGLVGQWIDHALGESDNAAANRVLQWLGDGEIYAGGRRVTEMMRTLGFTNSFIQTGYDDKSNISQIPTEANSRNDWNTNPDTHLQSTPADLGRLLAEIYRCQAGDGLLIETFPNELTPEECAAILFYLSHDEFTEMIWAGLPRPAESWIIHKHGFVNEAHSDLALVWGPGGPYVIAVYLWSPVWMNWRLSNSAMREISRIVWTFFDYKAAQEGIEAPPPLALEPPPNYVPVNTYTSRAARSGR